jgi:hypothetical protein
MSKIASKLIISFFEEQFKHKVTDLCFYKNKMSKRSGLIKYRTPEKTYKDMEFDIEYKNSENYIIKIYLKENLDKDILEKNIENEFYKKFIELKNVFYFQYKINYNFYDSVYFLEKELKDGVSNIKYSKKFLYSIKISENGVILPVFEVEVNKDYTRIKNNYISSLFLNKKLKPFNDINSTYARFENNLENTNTLMDLFVRVFTIVISSYSKNKLDYIPDEIFKSDHKQLIDIINQCRYLEEIKSY